MEAVSLKALASVSPREFADILAGPPERLRSGWLNSIKHLPVRYR